jgi:L-ribulokinase
MHVSDSPQTPALGAAISAAVAAGVSVGGYDSFEDAQSRMAAGADTTFLPNVRHQTVYSDLFAIYQELHDAFGGVASDSTRIKTTMKRLLSLRDGVTSDRQLVGDRSR